MGVYLLVTSALLANLYKRYCNEEYEECTDDEKNFLVLPLFGFLTMMGWVRYILLFLSLYTLVKIHD